MWQSSFSNSWITPAENNAVPNATVQPVPYFSNSWLPVISEESRNKTVPAAFPVPVPESSFVKVNGQYWAMVPVSPQSVPLSSTVPEIKTGDIEDELSAQNLYKTELCRSFQETGNCRYGTKCQFAHGKHELRPVIRHPKYKTEVCKTFHTIGTCPYGKRCRFIHTRKIDTPAQEQTQSPPSNTFVNVTGNNWPTVPQPTKNSTPINAILSSFHKTVSPSIVTPPSQYESDITSLLDSDEEEDSKARLSFFQSLA